MTKFVPERPAGTVDLIIAENNGFLLGKELSNGRYNLKLVR